MLGRTFSTVNLGTLRWALQNLCLGVIILLDDPQPLMATQFFGYWVEHWTPNTQNLLISYLARVPRPVLLLVLLKAAKQQHYQTATIFDSREGVILSEWFVLVVGKHQEVLKETPESLIWDSPPKQDKIIMQ